ncbi:MAG: hypothetical protein AB1801_12100 [Chloroflexota bacterium]
MSQTEMPIFTRTFDFLTWLLPVANHFPRAHRHTFTQRRLARLIAAYKTDEISAEQVIASVQGWVNHVRYGNTIGLRKAIFAETLNRERRPP